MVHDVMDLSCPGWPPGAVPTAAAQREGGADSRGVVLVLVPFTPVPGILYLPQHAGSLYRGCGEGGADRGQGCRG